MCLSKYLASGSQFLTQDQIHFGNEEQNIQFGLVSSCVLFQVHCSGGPSEVQQEPVQCPSAGPHHCYLGAVFGCGESGHLWSQPGAGSRPQRVQTGGRPVCCVLVRLLLLRALSHHALLVLLDVSRPAAVERPESISGGSSRSSSSLFTVQLSSKAS